MLDALISCKEPKTGTDGTMSSSVDIANPATGDDIHMIVKELLGILDAHGAPLDPMRAFDCAEPSARGGHALCMPRRRDAT